MYRDLRRATICVAVFAIIVGLASSARHAARADDSFTTVQAGAERLLEDLKFLLSLTNSTEQQQWENVEANVDIFLEGIDRQRALRIDVLLGGKAVRYRPSFPITRVDDFLDNLDSFGIENKQLAPNFYELKEAFEGYLRIKDNYASIGEQANDVPADLPDPATALQPLLEAGYDVAMELRNNPDGMAGRRQSFEETRTEVLAALRKKGDETDDEYQLRKLLAAQQLDEAERFFVESRQLTAGWITDVEKGQGVSKLYLSALPETSLQQSIDLLAQSPSYFSAVPLPDDAILRSRLNFPLDDFRKENFSELYVRLKPVVHALIDKREALTGDGKDAAHKAADLAIELLDAGREAGLVDGFGYIRPDDSGHHTLVGGVQAVDGNRVLEILKLLPQIRDDLTVREEVDQQGDARIHAVSVWEPRVADFKSFFGDDATIYVGLSRDAVYLAAGPNAVSELKQAIERSGVGENAKPDPVFGAFFIKLYPFVQQVDKFRDRVKPVASEQQTLKEAERELQQRDELRRRALDAFKEGGDTFSLEIRREDDHVTGSGLFNVGVLRFIGKEVARFSKENLE